MSQTQTYEEHRAKSVDLRNAMSAIGRDIGPLPEIAKPRRKVLCKRHFERFCKTYLPETFAMPFCPDHLKVIAKIEQAVLKGGLFAMAMPRASGKTSLAEAAAIWAVVYGHRQCVILIGADHGAAERMLASIRTELETSDILYDDFPEVCYPIRRLNRIPHRCRGQTHLGKPTFIEWSSDVVVVATVPGSKASGAILKTAGLTASIRGMKHKRADGVPVRPDLVVCDDCQTDESARSASQCAYRERVLGGAILGLAGPRRQIAGIMPCTVIAPGDLADRMLDKDLHPEWQGERTKLLYAFPTNEKLWEEYGRIRRDSLRAGTRGEEATEFYRSNRAAMDEGAQPAWAERFRDGEVSAVQHAMNLWLDDPQTFMSEYQNDPQPIEKEDQGLLRPEEVLSRLSGYKRGIVPAEASRLTAFVDIQQDLLYWLVAAWSEDFTGWIVDYGAWPEQGRAYFRLDEARPTLADATGVQSIEGSLWAGLEQLTGTLLGREWQRESGGGMRIERCLVDAGWGLSTKLVYRFCRASSHAGVLLPSLGRAISASARPIHDWTKHAGDRLGMEIVILGAKPGRGRLVIADVNWWKTFMTSRLRIPQGEAGALTLFTADAHTHRLLADHLTAEYPVKTEGRGRSLEEWKLRAHKPDNHWLDALVGCGVGASIQGCQPAEFRDRPKEAGDKPKVSWSEMQRMKQAERRERR